MAEWLQRLSKRYLQQKKDKDADKYEPVRMLQHPVSMSKCSEPRQGSTREDAMTSRVSMRTKSTQNQESSCYHFRAPRLALVIYWLCASVSFSWGRCSQHAPQRDTGNTTGTSLLNIWNNNWPRKRATENIHHKSKSHRWNGPRETVNKEKGLKNAKNSSPECSRIYK